MPSRPFTLVGTLVLLQLAPAQVPAEGLRPVRAVIQGNRSLLRQQVQQAGGLLEVYRNRKIRLFLDPSGALLFRKASAPVSNVRRVRLWRWFQRKNLPGVSVEALGRRIERLLQPRPPQRRQRRQPLALLPDGREVPPDDYRGGYHGKRRVDPERVLRDGLPRRGNDWRLREHSEAQGNSAFRGTTEVVADPQSENGAAYWAGKGGWVFEIRGVPSWDVNAQLFGRVQLPDRTYRGNLMHGENEIAIPARVPPHKIKAYGQVEEDSSGRLLVRRWIQNPRFRE